MSPRHLRAREGVSRDEMAWRLGVRSADVAALEALPLTLWELRDLGRYAAALGFTVRIVAVNANGAEMELTA